LALAIREGKEWRFIGHVGTGFSHATLKELHGKLKRSRSGLELAVKFQSNPSPSEHEADNNCSGALAKSCTR
jgi:ATP-dependent DNA ligase